MQWFRKYTQYYTLWLNIKWYLNSFILTIEDVKLLKNIVCFACFIGRVIDWSIDFLKTATGASQVYDIDYTSALLGQNVDQDDSNATQPQEEEVCTTANISISIGHTDKYIWYLIFVEFGYFYRYVIKVVRVCSLWLYNNIY